jgi:hypothetical protein
MDAAEQTSYVLTAIALVEARLEGRDGDLSYLLDYCTNHRAVAVVLADALAQCLRGEFGDQAAQALGQLRQRVLGSGEPPAPA